MNPSQIYQQYVLTFNLVYLMFVSITHSFTPVIITPINPRLDISFFDQLYIIPIHSSYPILYRVIIALILHRHLSINTSLASPERLHLKSTLCLASSSASPTSYHPSHHLDASYFLSSFASSRRSWSPQLFDSWFSFITYHLSILQIRTIYSWSIWSYPLLSDSTKRIIHIYKYFSRSKSIKLESTRSHKSIINPRYPSFDVFLYTIYCRQYTILSICRLLYMIFPKIIQFYPFSSKSHR